MRPLGLALTLLVPLAGCSDDKDPTITSSAPSAATADATTADEGTTDSVTTGDGGDDTDLTATSQTTANPTTADPSTTGTPDETTTADPSDPSVSTTTTTTADPTNDPVDPDEGATQLCVDTINMYRATLGLPAYQRWTDAEDCSDGEALSDGQTNTPHGAFGMCGEFAQNECPGWSGPPAAMITDCLAQMWAEGPGEDFNKHGHYINMSSEGYTQVACGFAEVNGEIWAVQNFR